MFASCNDSFVLSNGVTIPCIGYGTWQSSEADAEQGVKNALQSGYRHIDTAAAYGNEAAVGRGIKESGVKREDIFLTSKHWITERGYTKTLAAVDASLKALGTDYLDLYLIHWPCTPVITERWAEVNAATWRGFEEAYRLGKLRAIGVSNFLPEQILALESTALLKPMVNQIECHPGYTQDALVNWSREHGMVVEAWSPLGCGAVLQDKTVNAVAVAHGVTPAQVCVRFALQNGVLPIPKSVHADRILQNKDVFGFELSEEEMLELRTIPPLGYSGFHPSNAPADTLYGGNCDIE